METAYAIAWTSNTIDSAGAFAQEFRLRDGRAFRGLDAAKSRLNEIADEQAAECVDELGYSPDEVFTGVNETGTEIVVECGSCTYTLRIEELSVE